MTEGSSRPLTNHRLRRRVRLLEVAISAESLVLLLLLACGWRSPDGEVRAQELVLVDDKDEVRSHWVITDDAESEFATFDRAWPGRRVSIDTEGGGNISVDSGESRRWASLISEDRGCDLLIENERDKLGVFLAGDKSGYSHISVWGEHRNVIWSAPGR